MVKSCRRQLANAALHKSHASLSSFTKLHDDYQGIVPVLATAVGARDKQKMGKTDCQFTEGGQCWEREEVHEEANSWISPDICTETLNEICQDTKERQPGTKHVLGRSPQRSAVEGSMPQVIQIQA